jgi:hypothetical protein
MINTESVEAAKAALGYWQQYPIPAISEGSTDSERIWHNFLWEKRLAYNALCSEPRPQSLAAPYHQG